MINDGASVNVVKGMQGPAKMSYHEIKRLENQPLPSSLLPSSLLPAPLLLPLFIKYGKMCILAMHLILVKITDAL